MKHNLLRAFIRGKHLEEEWVIEGNLIIDAISFLRYSYEKSGCQFILGGEYDRYARYMRNELRKISDKVTCFVIYGSQPKDISNRLEKHQKRIDTQKEALKKYYKNEYSNIVAFEEMVCKDLLDELSIRYLVCEGDNKEAIITLAKQMRCPVLTKHFEMILYGVSCITPNSLRYHRDHLVGDIYKAENCKRCFRIQPPLKSSFLTMTDQENPAFAAIPLLTPCNVTNQFYFVVNVFRWIQRQTSKNRVVDSLLTCIDKTEEKKKVLSSIKTHDKLVNSQSHFALKYFLTNNSQALRRTDDWFVRGIANGRIAAPFINLKNNGILSGSWLIADHKRQDAMLPALDIVFYALALLKESTKLKISFIGRRGNIRAAWEIEKEFDHKLPSKALFKYETIDLFKLFVSHVLPGFRFELLKNVPKECWLMIISLVYYVVGKDLLIGYAVLLSYVIVGPVSNMIGPIERSSIFVLDDTDYGVIDSGRFGLSRQDCLAAAKAFLPMFYIEDLDKIYDTTVLHTIAEFKHCWQMMNHLNRLVGQRVKSTKFHEAYNGTFVNNVLFYLKDKPDPVEAVRSLLGKTTVFDLFETIAVTFEECLLSVTL